MLHPLKGQWLEGSSGTGAAPVLVAAKLRSASLLEPLQYGDALIGLSGIYAIMNAIRLAAAKQHQLTDRQAEDIIDAGFRFLDGRLTPRQVFKAGCRVSVWRGMAQAMVEAARVRLNLRLRLDRLIVESREDKWAAFNVIEHAIANWQPVMMLCRGGRYTVVCGFTRSSLLLFDSAGACWLSKRASGVPGDSDNARHLLFPASFMSLRA